MDQSEQNIETQVTSETVESDMKETETFVKTAEDQLEGLKTAVIEKMAELEELQAIASEQEKKFETEVEGLRSKIKELEETLSTANVEKEQAVSELLKVKEEALLNQRLQELRNLKLLRSEEEAQARQALKIKGMNEQEFDDYKIELIDIRNQALGSLAEGTTEATEGSADSAASEVVESIEASEETKEKIQQVIASLNSESESDKAIDAEKALETQDQGELKEEASVALKPELITKALLGILKYKNK